MDNHCMCGSHIDDHDMHENHSFCSQEDYYRQDLNFNQKENIMNYSTAIMLLNEDIRAVKVIYEHEDNTSQTRYIFKTFDKSIEVDDLVTVPTDTRHRFTVVKVIEVDVDVDFESDIKINWIVGKVDTEENERLLSEEVKMIEVMKESEKRRKREEIKKSMMDLYEEEGLEKLAIVNMSGE